MKRILIALIAMMMFCLATEAQIKKTGSMKTETLVSLRMGVVTLNQSEGSYYIAMTTTNQFDDAMILKLGDTKESARQSLTDLIDILESLQGNDTEFINNGYGREFRLFKVMGALYVAADGYAGNGNMGKSELNRMLKALK